MDWNMVRQLLQQVKLKRISCVMCNKCMECSLQKDYLQQALKYGHVICSEMQSQEGLPKYEYPVFFP